MDFKAVQEYLQNNDSRAIRLLYDHLGDRLFQLAYAIVKSKEVAEEIIGDILLKVWQKREEMAAIENLRLYLYVTTRNYCFSYLRKTTGRPKEFSFEEVYQPYYHFAKSPEELLITREILQTINQTINCLPAKCKLIFKLAKEDGLKHKEIAVLLDISIKTVESQMAIALKRIYSTVTIQFPGSKLAAQKK
ncbi:MAG: RNA polymerase sigma-70 factor [Chitinophagaceae bacterium]|nr:RNA polymerase sigma-70 factor [Chitinophagaceae bacterium]MCW5928881.1 RNA polymerase sigma-70 factor [Chitinophagaceae bacterium]